MTNAIGAAAEPERAVESAIAKVRKARKGTEQRPEAVNAPAEPDPRGQLVDREA